jgi:3-oxoacyl-[acyl-carrier-protein] synthase II
VAIMVGTVGPTSTVTAGHAAGASSLCYGVDLAGGDHADAIVCIGADALTDTVLTAYSELGVLTGSEPTEGGDGFALGEAGVALLVERSGKAKERGARAHGRVLGYGITSDAAGVGRIDPEGDGIERAMRVALERAGIDAGDVKAVWSAQAGLGAADEAESKAIDKVFGGGVPVLSPKLRLGEPMGAGPSLTIALAMHGWAQEDDEHSPRGPVLVNGISLGGTNFSVALAPPD